MSFLSEEDFNNSSLIFLNKTRIRSQIIYTTTLFATIVALAILPFIYMTVSVQGMGLLQSSVEKSEILAPTNGRLITVNLKDNQRIKKGATLITIDASLSSHQDDLASNHILQLENQLSDIKQILSNSKEHPRSLLLATSEYLAKHQQHIENLRNAGNVRDQASKIYERYRILLDKKAVTQSEYEEYQFKYKQAISDFEIVRLNYKTQLEAEAVQYRNELRELNNQRVIIDDQRKQSALKASISGTLQNLNGIQSGDYVFANQKLGEISPDSLLIAYCYISPADIGLIKLEQPVRFQIDAFNYNQWGMLDGNVIDISDDITFQNELPYFKVKCKLNQSFLTLKNGYKGKIKKGMTFKARFTVAERSIYQLLYDNIDNWLNP